MPALRLRILGEPHSCLVPLHRLADSLASGGTHLDWLHDDEARAMNLGAWLGVFYIPGATPPEPLWPDPEHDGDATERSLHFNAAHPWLPGSACEFRHCDSWYHAVSGSWRYSQRFGPELELLEIRSNRTSLLPLCDVRDYVRSCLPASRGLAWSQDDWDRATDLGARGELFDTVSRPVISYTSPPASPV